MDFPNWTKKPFVWVGLLLVLGLLTWLVSLPDQPGAAAVDPAAYRTDVLAARAQKNTFLHTSAESPVADKTAFRGLLYYEPDAGYRVTAQLDLFPAGQAPRLVVRLTDGSEELYEQYGHAHFSLQGTPCRLLILKYQKNLTVLFQDATSGNETYGGGRYLDIDPGTVAANQVVLDFNTAYNPYCAYNPSYACPLPPPENRLAVAVTAGERFERHD